MFVAGPRTHEALCEFGKVGLTVRNSRQVPVATKEVVKRDIVLGKDCQDLARPCFGGRERAAIGLVR